jgi:hypothetical protein
MKAYEFDTVVKNGVINIPKKYLDKQLSYIRVIVLSKSDEVLSVKKERKFSAMRLKTKGFTFNREEANER